jgi:site-specific DNA recombinase
MTKLRQMGFRVVWRSHSEGTRTVVDDFRLDGDLTMDLDADWLFGPMADVVSVLSDPANIEAYNAIPE